MDNTPCKTKDCNRPARCAIKTSRPTRAKLQTTIFYDDREAPKTASPYCKPCAVTLMKSLAETLIDDE